MKQWRKGYPELVVFFFFFLRKRFVNNHERSPAACDPGLLPSRVFALESLVKKLPKGLSAPVLGKVQVAWVSP